jgi:hypothetical protein
MNDQVMGILDQMREYSTISARMGDALIDEGIIVDRALTQFNANTEAAYNVGNCGSLLATFGAQVHDVDHFVTAIAEELRKADSGTITNQMEANAARAILPGAKSVERMAGDVAMICLLTEFESFDSVKNGKSDGRISMKDVERVAKDSNDPIKRAAAAWLLSHKEVLTALDRADSPTDTTDNRISREDIARYLIQRAAYQVMEDNRKLFDAATTGKSDGKISRKDIEHVAITSTDPDIVAAANYLLNDSRTLDDQAVEGDQIVGRYELEKVANKNGEPVPREKVQVSALRKVGCGAAKEMSYIGYADMVIKAAKGESLLVDGSKDVAKKIVGRVAADTATDLTLKGAANLTQAEARKRLLAKTLAKGLGPQVQLAATAVDGVCRLTEPDTSSGKIKTKKQEKDEEKLEEKPTGPQSTPQVMAQK